MFTARDVEANKGTLLFRNISCTPARPSVRVRVCMCVCDGASEYVIRPRDVCFKLDERERATDDGGSSSSGGGCCGEVLVVVVVVVVCVLGTGIRKRVTARRLTHAKNHICNSKLGSLP